MHLQKKRPKKKADLFFGLTTRSAAHVNQTVALINGVVQSAENGLFFETRGKTPPQKKKS